MGSVEAVGRWRKTYIPLGMGVLGIFLIWFGLQYLYNKSGSYNPASLNEVVLMAFLPALGALCVLGGIRLHDICVDCEESNEARKDKSRQII